MGNVWSFQDPANGRLYRCEVDSMGNEQWYVMPPTIQHEWISLAEAARLRGVTIKAISRAIARKRLSTVECNGRPKVCRSDVLTLTLRYRKSPVLKSAQQLAINDPGKVEIFPTPFTFAPISNGLDSTSPTLLHDPDHFGGHMKSTHRWSHPSLLWQ
jgi:hypothetical protein